MFLQNFIQPRAAVHELSIVRAEKKNSGENNTVRRYRVDSKKFLTRAA